MEKNTLKEIMLLFGYKDCKFGSPQKGYRNTSWKVSYKDKTFNLLGYKQNSTLAAMIRTSNKAGILLQKAGMPARVPLDGRILKVTGSNISQLFALYNYLPGHTVPWEAYTMGHIKLLGETMSNMHHAWSNYSDASFPDIVLDRLLAINQNMLAYYSQTGVQMAMTSKLKVSINLEEFSKFEEVLALGNHLPSRQLLHMDFVRGNILFDREDEQKLVVSGIIDFEKVAIGHPLFDIARTLAFLLVDCKYKTEAKIRKYFLISGYQKRGSANNANIIVKLKNAEINMLEELISFFLVYDFYKFMLHNPYEHLEENSHYLRTYTILLQRGLIAPVV